MTKLVLIGVVVAAVDGVWAVVVSLLSTGETGTGVVIGETMGERTEGGINVGIDDGGNDDSGNVGGIDVAAVAVVVAVVVRLVVVTGVVMLAVVGMTCWLTIIGAFQIGCGCCEDW